MILRQITVKGMKCFRDEVTVGRFGGGLNMIFGPNETGKSTLIEATARALFDGYSVTGEAIERLVPWGTSLAPEVVLDFEVRDEGWRLEKRFHSAAACSVSRRERDSWSLVHERDSADDFLRELLRGEAPGRGAGDLRNWGLARMLWCINDPCMVGRAGEVTCVVPDVVAGQLRAVLGETSVGTALEPVMACVVDRYDKHFTPSRGSVRTNSRIDRLDEEIDRLETELADAQARVEEVEEAARSLGDVRLESADLAEERVRLQKRISDYREEASEVDALEREIEDAEKELKRSEARHRRIAGDLKTFIEASEAAECAGADLKELMRDLENLDADLRAAQQLTTEAEEAHREAQAERRTAADAFERGRRMLEAQSLLEERRTLTKLLAEIEQLRGRAEELEDGLREMPCPSDDEIRRAESLEGAVQVVQAQLEAAGLSVTVEAQREQEVTLGGGEDEVRETLQQGEQIAYTAGASLEIYLPEVARVSVRSGASEPAQLEAELQEDREQLSALLASYAAEDAATLRELQRKHERVEEDLQRLEEYLRDAADPWESVEQVRERQVEIRSELKKRLNELELTEELLAEVAPPDLHALEDTYSTAQKLEDELQETLDGRRRRAGELAEQRNHLRESRSELDGLLRENEATMKHLLQGCECEDEEGLRTLLSNAEKAYNELEVSLAGQQERLPSEEEDPRRLIETSEKALEDVRGRETELGGRRLHHEEIIERARTEGRYERVTQVEEDLADKRRELQETWREAQAIKLLRQIVESRRSEVAGGALPGLEERVTRMLRAITGRDRALLMNEQMSIDRVVDGDGPHAPTVLSSGTREQLDLVTRLALGETWAEHYGPTMMVLDDALLCTDPRRHDRIKQVLQRAGEVLQIFILTSHPERYRGIVPTEAQFDLEAIRRGGG